MNEQEIIGRYEPVKKLAVGADHIDVKQFEGEVTMREFIANMFSYMPGWLRFLYGVRSVFVRFLGMKQEGMPHSVELRPEDVTMEPGKNAAFFEVVAAEEDRYYVAEASESHLTAYLGLVVEAKANAPDIFYIITIVHYHRWTGPVYFNVIRPFHHIVVRQMGKAAVGDIPLTA